MLCTFGCLPSFQRCLSMFHNPLRASLVYGKTGCFSTQWKTINCLAFVYSWLRWFDIEAEKKCFLIFYFFCPAIAVLTCYIAGSLKEIVNLKCLTALFQVALKSYCIRVCVNVPDWSCNNPVVQNFPTAAVGKDDIVLGGSGRAAHRESRKVTT